MREFVYGHNHCSLLSFQYSPHYNTKPAGLETGDTASCLQKEKPTKVWPRRLLLIHFNLIILPVRNYSDITIIGRIIVLGTDFGHTFQSSLMREAIFIVLAVTGNGHLRLHSLYDVRLLELSPAVSLWDTPAEVPFPFRWLHQRQASL